ncbi:hypothetical protein [Terrabacter lapilli]|uniref:hypothetical protein n=1 Tax=Terrabacter lapilli TaxID=436231 RepID=UPI0031CDE93C
MAGQIAYRLADLQPVSSMGNWAKASTTINGVLFANSIVIDWAGLADAQGQASQGEYNLERRCSALTFTAGIADDAPADTAAQFRVYSDDVLLAQLSIPFGHDMHRSILLPRTLRLRLVALAESHAAPKAAFGDATVYCSRLD